MSTGAVATATNNCYTCPQGYVINGAACKALAAPVCTYTPWAGWQGDTYLEGQAGDLENNIPGYWRCTDIYVLPGGPNVSGEYITQSHEPNYICPTAHTLSGTGATSVCTAAAATVFTCPAGYQLSGSQCKVFTNNAATGTNSTSSDRTLTFVYGPEHQRIKQVVALSASAPAALQAGAGTTWYSNGDDSQGLSYEKTIKSNGAIDYKHYLSAGGLVFAMQVTRRTSSTAAGTDPGSLRYFHNDHLGSTAAVSNEAGQVIERMAYDPWGKRRNTNGLVDATDKIVGLTTDRGYTLHEHLDEVGIVHMNGRLYDPLMGRFMSADPFIQAPHNLKSFNRYSYVHNNLLYFQDPTGHEPWGIDENCARTQLSDIGNGTLRNGVALH